MKKNIFNEALINIRKKPGLLIGSGVIVIMLIFGIWWIMRPSYEVLLSNLSEDNRAKVLAVLMQGQVPYEIKEGNGDILVPVERLAELRAELSGQGLPSQPNIGLEIFGQGDYGMSEFSQQINYQRALEGELARTIQALNEVQHVRVHITLGKSSIFDNRKEAAKASVALHLNSGQQLSSEQVHGIRQLVSTSVPTLTPEQVIIIDEKGRNLTSNEADGGKDRLTILSQLELDYEQRALKLARKILPDSDFEISVKLQLNFDKIHSIKEDVIPAKGGQVGYVLKEREQSSSKEGEGTTDAVGSQSNNNAEIEYLFGRERAEIEHATGKIENINVGIVAPQNITPENMESLRQVILSGLGMHKERGDNLAIVNAAAISKTPILQNAIQPPLVSPSPKPVQKVETVPATPWLVIILSTLTGVLLLALSTYIWLLKRRRLARLTPPLLTTTERDQLLHQVQHWLAHDTTR